MVDLTAILPHVTGFAVVMARLSGLFLFSPVLSSAVVPRRAKAMLALLMTLCIYPTIDHSATLDVPLSVVTLGPLMAMEILIGAAIGVLMLTPLWAVQLAGTFMGQQMGLSLAPILNPATDIEGDTLGQLLFMMALAIFVTLGGIEAMWEGLILSFKSVPAGAFRIDDRLLETLSGMIAGGFHLAMRVSMPVLAIVLAESVAVGFITKTLPSLNFMSFGFPVRIVLALAVLAASLAGVHTALNADIRSTIRIVGQWASDPANN